MKDELGTFLWAVKTDKKHKHYDRVVEYADKLQRLATGEGIEKLMRKFDLRESEEMFQQALRIMQNITPTVWRNLVKPQYKVPRSNSLQREISYKDNNHDRAKELNAVLENFSGDISLDKYLGSQWVDLANIDPNAFIVVEWKAFEAKKRAKPYPFEINSKEAVYYDYDDDDKLLFLMVKRTYSDIVVDKYGELSEKDFTEFIWYGRNRTYKLTQIHDKDITNSISNALGLNAGVINGIGVNIDGKTYTRDDKGHEYILETPSAHNLDYVPARVVGFVRDPLTKGVTRLSLLDEAVPILMKMLKATREFDLTMALHAFPQKIQYVRRCADVDCVGGRTVTGDVCGTCDGQGFEVAKTAQEAITLQMPRSKEDMISLDNIVKYVYPPVDLVKFQEEYIRRLTVMCKEAVYNTELFSRKQVAETATGKNIDLQNIYDSLYPMADAYAKTWNFFVDTVARVVDLDEGLVHFLIFSKDFKMKSLTDLYNDLVLIAQSGGDEFVKQSIQEDIVQIIYAENKRELLKYTVKKELFPFNGKTEKEIMLALASPDMIDPKIRTLWANYGWIFEEIEIEQSEKGVDYYELPRKKQREILFAKVDTIKIEPKTPELIPLPNERERQGNTGRDRQPAV